jgi:hypothetical protein
VYCGVRMDRAVIYHDDVISGLLCSTLVRTESDQLSLIGRFSPLSSHTLVIK